MRVLHVTYNMDGGAGIAAQRIHKALLREGIRSSILAVRGKDAQEFLPAMGWIRFQVNRAENVSLGKLKKLFLGSETRSLSVFKTGLHKTINKLKPDIVHLHWVNAEMISIEQFVKINAPVVWTLHDMWAFSGAEHVTMDKRYVTGYQISEGQKSEAKESHSMHHAPCSLRPQLDIDRWTFRRKQKAWKNWHPHIVTPSHWLAECARKSCLFKRESIDVISNCLDLHIFRPMGQEGCRRKLGLSLDKKLILFGAHNPFDRNKGGDLLSASLRKLHSRESIEIIIFGATEGSQLSGLPTRWMGKYTSESSLSELYNAADLVVVPSRLENLPNTVAEAIACGIPVIAFNIGGIPDMVEHEKDGYLAEPYDTADLARGMEWVLKMDQNERSELRAASRQKAESMFTENAVAEAYRGVYEGMLNLEENS